MVKKINLAFATFRKSDKCSLTQEGYGIYFNAVLSGFYLKEILPTSGSWLTVSHSFLHWEFSKISAFYVYVSGSWKRTHLRIPDRSYFKPNFRLILCDRYDCFTSIASVLKCPTDWPRGIEKGRNKIVNILYVCINLGPSNKCKIRCYWLHFRGFI